MAWGLPSVAGTLMTFTAARNSCVTSVRSRKVGGADGSSSAGSAEAAAESPGRSRAVEIIRHGEWEQRKGLKLHLLPGRLSRPLDLPRFSGESPAHWAALSLERGPG